MDLIAVITALKALGIDTGRIIEAAFLFMTFFGMCMWMGYKYIGPWVKSLLSKVDEATKSVATMSQSVDALNDTMKDYMTRTDLRMEEGDSKFLKMSEEIKQNAEAADRRFNEINKQIRYLITKQQLESKGGSDENSI